ncbi:MAG: DNRLRE domain-containing protein [Terriglobales bacterium]
MSLLILMSFAAVAAAQVTPSDDTYTLTSAPATNYGSNGGLQLQSGKATVFVRFDLNSIPAGYTDADVAKATLKLYVNSVAAPGSFSVNYVLGPWSETTVTATLEPAIGTAIASGVNVATANKEGYILVDVTPALGAWLDGTQANDGIALVANSPLSVIFSSKENSVASHPPELDIVFTGSGPRGPQGFSGTTGPAGIQGPIGPTGATGAQGPVGKTGAVGTKGPAGATGPQGATGATGAPGPAGATGPQGPIGLMGAQGPEGPQGAAGTNGTGFNFRNAFDPSASYAANDVVTYSGSTYGAVAASSGPNNQTPDTNPSAWTVMAQQGAAGATGSQGPAGAAGAQGLTGLTGATGAQGRSVRWVRQVRRGRSV